MPVVAKVCKDIRDHPPTKCPPYLSTDTTGYKQDLNNNLQKSIAPFPISHGFLLT